MNQAPFTLWQAIERLARQAPLTPGAVEQSLGSPLQIEKQDAHRTRWVGGEVALLGNVRIARTGLTTLSQEQANPRSTVGLFLTGACITRDQVEAQYGVLHLVAAPRGRSLSESSVWESAQAWGQLRFAFRQDNPECLHSVSIAPGSAAEQHGSV